MSAEEIKVHNLSKKKKQAKKPIPHTRGRMMDFAPRRQKITKTAPKPTAAVVVTEVETVATQVVTPPKEAAAPLGAHIGLMAEAKPIPKPEPKPAPAPKPEPIPEPEPTPMPDSRATVADALADKVETTTTTVEAVEYRPIPLAHDPTSPFLSSVNVEKRPLSSTHLPTEPLTYPHYTKNIYDDPNAELDKPHRVKDASDHHETKIVQTKKKSNKVTMVVLILATAALGVALGVLVYFAIFAQV